jgi:hypothetical protein
LALAHSIPKLFLGFWSERKKMFRRNLLRQLRSISLDEDLNLPDLCFPQIQFLIIVAGKDIEIINFAIT